MVIIYIIALMDLIGFKMCTMDAINMNELCIIGLLFLS